MAASFITKCTNDKQRYLTLLAVMGPPMTTCWSLSGLAEQAGMSRKHVERIVKLHPHIFSIRKRGKYREFWRISW